MKTSLTLSTVSDPGRLIVGVGDDFEFLFVDVSIFPLFGEKVNLSS
jgi:hypothetical protein